jgi:hypothetical protein
MTDTKQIESTKVDLHGKTTTIEINGESFVIRKLALGKYAAILKAMKALPQKINEFGATSNDKIIASLPAMMSDSFPELLEILSIATDIPTEKLENEFGLDDITVVIKAIFEVNNFAVVKKNLGSLWATAKTQEGKSPTMTTGSKQ